MWTELCGLHCGITVAMQAATSALFPPAEIHTGCSRTLQCTDVTVTRAAETRTNVHGDQQQHRPSLPTKGLRSTHSLPQGSQPSKTRQVGNQSAHCFSPPGDLLASIYYYSSFLIIHWVTGKAFGL